MEITGQNTTEEDASKGKTSSGTGEQLNEQLEDSGGNHQDNWLKGPLKQEMIRTLISLCKTTGRGGVCSLEGGSNGKARPKRPGEA